MHYHAEVWIPDTEDVEGRVAEAMAPYQEVEDYDKYSKLPFHWDWYQIGGAMEGQTRSQLRP